MNLSELICAAVLSLGIPNADLACEKMDLVVQESIKNNVEPEVMVALIQTESNWTPSAVSPAYACGLTQVIPKYTGGRASGGVKYTCNQLKIADTSIVAGTKIFSYWLHNYGKCKIGKCRIRHYRIGLCGYNAGYRCKGDSPNKQGRYYASKVLKRADRIKKRMRKIKADAERKSVDER